LGLKYQAREGAITSANLRAEKAERELAEAKAAPAQAEKAEWDEATRERVKGIYEELPKQARQPIDNNLDQYIRESDQIKEVDKEETEAPQNLEVAYQSLLRKFEDLEGVDIDALRRLGLTNKVVAHLPQILRLKLDERRAEQARQRQTNKERKEVEGYFATHEVKIEVNKKDDIVVDDDWQANLDKAVGLGIEPLAEVLLLPVPTGLKDMTNLEFRLEQSGRISQTVLTSQKLTASPDLDARKSRLTVLALDGVEKPFLLVRQFQDGQEVFTLERSGEKIGDVKFNEQGGLVVSWKEMTAGEVLGASWGITNLCEETWGKDRGLKGLKLIAVAEAEAVPTEPVEPVKPAAVAPTGTVLEAESPAPEPEKPTVKPKEVPEIPDWLKNLESASSQEEEEKLPPRAQKTL
ncbi:hypothetical protein L6272_06630, partial [Microgenomates group bacterium]|nr:hypothetical protein [Microgenomates group bacterium]